MWSLRSWDCGGLFGCALEVSSLMHQDHNSHGRHATNCIQLPCYILSEIMVHGAWYLQKETVKPRFGP